MQKVKIGLIGCGNISEIYLKNCTKLFTGLEVAACADLDMEKAEIKAETFGVPKACTVEEMLGDPEIRIVLNLTVPRAHAEINLAALEAGKSIYCEKPLATNRADGARILGLAKEKGLRVGCAPDTFLGAGLQTCRKVIDDGWIGRPVAAAAFMMNHGTEGWHPDPEFFYKPGGGPMFDMGPYYLTALISLIGPIKSVTGSAAVSFPERTVGSAPKFGTKIKVETPTHIAGTLDFENGAIGTIVTSFDIWGTRLPFMEIYGTLGTLCAPDPNFFDGPVFVKRKDASEWKEIPLTHGFSENSRGVGLKDMADALLQGNKHRADGEMAYHVLDAMQGFLDSAAGGKRVDLSSSCSRPEALPPECDLENAPPAGK